MGPNPQFAADLVLLAEEIYNGKFSFLCNESYRIGMGLQLPFSCIALVNHLYY